MAANSAPPIVGGSPRAQIQTINWLTFLLESDLRTLPPDDTAARARILDQLDINRSVLAPIRRLPVELLSYMFSLVVQDSPLRTIDIAVTPARICTCWRKVARGHAALWTTVVVDNPGGFDEYRELFLPLTRDMLLDLRCDNREILRDLWDRMAPYASRWRRITIEARLSMLPDLQVLYMEKLERLVVFAYDAPISVDLSALDFVVAPRLRHIALTLDELQSERQLHVPATRTLTSLEITSMSPFLVALTLPLLHQITAPLVQQLVLSNVPAYGSRSLLAFLARGQAAQSLLVLRLTDKLWQLHFDELLSNRDFFDRLIQREDRPTLLPSLKAFAIVQIFRTHPELHEVIGDVDIFDPVYD
ncbi:hypothetical protein K525DRAFT_271629 [Schizophyllum commune Loenen D]|nr:hypothetical protein K525DRAFT_271629 [Schizophyllum commune Loenen D]